MTSFTLCPTTAPSSMQTVIEVQASPHAVTNGSSRHLSKNRKEMSKDMPFVLNKNNQNNNNSNAVPQLHVVGGNGMSCSSSSRAYQATPFHPLVHERKMISPLKVGGEYNADLQQRTDTAPRLPRRHSPYHAPSIPSPQQHGTLDVSSSGGWPRLTSEPPIAEIQIPTGTSGTGNNQNGDKGEGNNNNNDDDADKESWINGECGHHNNYDEQSFERLESWKSMYFVAQRDLHVARAESQSIFEENRRLKRHLFELQRRLYESQRKRQRLANDMWKVPGSLESNATGENPSDDDDDNQGNQQARLRTRKILVPQQQEKENEKIAQARVQAADAIHLVPRAISCEESSGGELPKSSSLLLSSSKKQGQK